MPWASDEGGNFLEPPEAYRALLSADGFEVVKERNRAEIALNFFHAMKAKTAASGPPPFGLHIVMGDSAPQKVANMMALTRSRLHRAGRDDLPPRRGEPARGECVSKQLEIEHQLTRLIGQQSRFS